MSVTIIKPGFQTTVQDRGRYQYQKMGISVGGAMDLFALRAANALLGNEEDDPVLELTLQGAVIQFKQDTWISICGADLQPEMEGVSVPMWRPVAVKAGKTLYFHRAIMGCHAYLAVSNGFQVKRVMGSASTNLSTGIGGYHGRRLQKGDELYFDRMKPSARRQWDALQCKNNFDFPFAVASYLISPYLLPQYRDEPTIRFIPGHEMEWFTSASHKALLETAYQVLPQSNRMGYRLKGAPLIREQSQEMLSEAVTAGTVQVPPDGQPIVLMADRQTTGGYPRIAQIAQVDLPVLAQVPPGKRIRFAMITFDEAEKLLLQQERSLCLLRLAALNRWRRH